VRVRCVSAWACARRASVVLTWLAASGAIDCGTGTVGCASSWQEACHKAKATPAVPVGRELSHQVRTGRLQTRRPPIQLWAAIGLNERLGVRP